MIFFPAKSFFSSNFAKKNFKHDVGWDIYLIKFSVVTSVDISSLVEDCTCASVHHLNLRIQICKFHIHFLIISVEVWINSRLRISKKTRKTNVVNLTSSNISGVFLIVSSFFLAFSSAVTFFFFRYMRSLPSLNVKFYKTRKMRVNKYAKYILSLYLRPVYNVSHDIYSFVVLGFQMLSKVTLCGNWCLRR